MLTDSTGRLPSRRQREAPRRLHQKAQCPRQDLPYALTPFRLAALFANRLNAYSRI